MRQPKPWFRKGRGWYFQLNGKKIFLGQDKKHAQAQYHQLMAGGPATVQIPTTDIRVATILDAYLDWLGNRVREGTKAKRTYDWYKEYLQDFIVFEAPSYRVQDLTIDLLEPFHVYQWVDSHPGWKTGKRGAMIAVQRAFNWAAKAGLLKSIGSRSPLANLEKPQQGRREQLVTDEEYREALSLVNDEEFIDLLELSWETGCRPHELFTVQACYADLSTARWVFPIRLSKGRKVQRVVYLTERALEITRRLVFKRPTGIMLLSTTGSPWCVSSVKCRLQRLCRKLGRQRLRKSGLMPPNIPRLNGGLRNDPAARTKHKAEVLDRRQLLSDLSRQHGTRLNLYAFRHSMITESLVNGVDAVTTSILAGHRDTTMLSRHYAHLTQKHEHMRQAANRARAASVSG